MYKIKIDTYLKIILFISLISIISAFFIEYALGHQPCYLCLIQRIPYGLSVAIIILSFFLKKNNKFIILILTLIFSFSLIISSYHFGIEQGFLKESGECRLQNVFDIMSKEELLKQLQVKTVSCKDVTFRIFGFSLTTLNILISIVLVFILMKIFKNYEKFQK